MLRRALLTRLEAAIDRAVQDSGRAQALCAQLDGRRFRLAATGSPWQCELCIEHGAARLRLQPEEALSAAPDALVRGSVAALAGALGAGQQALLQSGALRIEGDAQIAERFAELLRCLRPDLEHELGRLTGPVPAHLLAEGVRGLWQRGRELLRSQSHAAADYLAHERQVLVSRPEAEHRYREIEAARERLDRLDARLQQLGTRP